MVAFADGAAAIESKATYHHGATQMACCVDIQPWDLEVIRCPHGEDDSNTQSLVSRLWEDDVNGKTSREPLALATRVNGCNCIVVPRRAKSSSVANGCHGEEASWRAMLLSITQPMASLHAILATAGHEVLIFAAPFAGRPCVVFRATDLSSVASLLIEAGFAIGPSTMLCTTPPRVETADVSSRAGVWSLALPDESLTQESNLPYAVRFESGTGLFIDVRIPTSCANSSQQSVEASSCGVCIPTVEGVAWHRTVSFQPPLRSRGCLEAEENPASWRQVASGCTAILELLSSGSQSGLWIFSGGLFARITGLPRGEGVVANYCCSDVKRLEQLVGDAVGAELRSQYEAILGRVERPGVLRVLRRSWIEADAASSPVTFYDGEQSEGGLIEVDKEAALVVHHTLGGGQQRWRILAMDEDPFTPAGGCRHRLDEDYASLFRAKETSKAQSSDESGSPRRKVGKKKKNKSRSPSIVIFDENDKKVEKKRSRDRDKRSKDRKRKSDSSESSKSRKDKGKKRGRDRDKNKARSESSKSKDKGKKRKRDKSSTSDDKKGKKRSSKDDKKRRSRSRKSERRRSRSKSKKKKDRSRSKSKKKKDRSRSRSKKKKDRSKSRSKSRRRKDKRSRTRSESNAKKAPSSLALKKRLGGFDSRTALGDTAIAPATAGLPIIVTRPTNGEQLPVLTQMETQELAAEIEVFLKREVSDANAATRLRNLPPHMARHVLNRGSLLGARDTAAVLNSRIRDAMLIGQGTLPIAAHAPGRQAAGHSSLDAFITRHNLDSQCAQLLKQLPPHLQAVAVELPMHEARNPNAFVMAQLQMPTFRQGAAAGLPQMFQVI